VCPDFPVSSSVNCNLDGEIADHAPRLPDPCDPNPCATGGASTRFVGDTSLANDLIAGEGLITTGEPGSTLSAAITTGFRFCPCPFTDPARRANCERDFGCVVRRAEYRAAPGATVWRPMTLTFTRGQQVAPSEAIVRYDRPNDDGLAGGGDYEAIWSFVADATDAGSLESGTFGERRTRAVFWNLAVEYPTPIVPFLPDTCNFRRTCPALVGNLNSHYWAAIVESPPAIFFREPDPEMVPHAPLLIPDGLCPTCAGAFPQPFFTTRQCAGPCPTPDVFARLQQADMEITDRVSPLVAGRLTDGTSRWLAPSEPREMLDLLDLRLVAVDPDTLDVQLLVSAGTGVLAPPAPQFGDKITDPPGAFPILRATRAQYLVVGGIPAPESQQILDLQTGQVHWLPLTGALPTDVAAATVDVVRERLFVVDTVPSDRGRGDDRRLLVVDLERGEGAVLLQRRSTRGRDSFALAAAPGGSFVLAVSNASARRHTLYWLSVDGRERLSVRGIAPGDGVVLGQMTAGAEGVSRAVEGRGGPGFRVVGTRWTEFRPPSPHAFREML
jgi:hypothetical protein